MFLSAAYNFSFDASTAHAELKVQGDTVTWEPQGVKGHDPRLRGKENKSRWGQLLVMMLLLFFYTPECILEAR